MHQTFFPPLLCEECVTWVAVLTWAQIKPCSFLFKILKKVCSFCIDTLMDTGHGVCSSRSPAVSFKDRHVSRHYW